MLAKQAQLIDTLFQILESRGVIESDDRKVFGQLARASAAIDAAVTHRWHANYLAAAKLVGVSTGLDP